MNPSLLQPLLELLKVENPADLSDAEIARFREWLRAAYENAGAEEVEPVEINLPAPLVEKPINTRPATAQVDRVLQAVLAWEGPARKRIARQGQRAVRHLPNSPARTADHVKSLSSVTE